MVVTGDGGLMVLPTCQKQTHLGRLDGEKRKKRMEERRRKVRERKN